MDTEKLVRHVGNSGTMAGLVFAAVLLVAGVGAGMFLAWWLL